MITRVKAYTDKQTITDSEKLTNFQHYNTPTRRVVYTRIMVVTDVNLMSPNEKIQVMARLAYRTAKAGLAYCNLRKDLG